MNNDDRPIYSDVGYFSRGRSGYRADPNPSKRDAVWAFAGWIVVCIIIGVVIGLR